MKFFGEVFIMKKTLVSELTATLVVGAASTTFAAANPFSDVPTDHWAYDAVAQLARDGVIEGYGDTTFQGESAITRYEMAQMVAKAMAKQDQANAADKAMIDKLAAEFSDELNNLGVRVSNLEKKMDNVYWKGELKYDYHGQKNEGESRGSSNELTLRLEPTMTVNDHWTIETQGDIILSNLGKDPGETEDSKEFNLYHLYVSGNYGNMTYNLGKVPFWTEQGLIADDEFTGAQIIAETGKLTTQLNAGRINNETNLMSEDTGNRTSDFKDTRHGDIYSIGFTYKADPKFSLGTGYYYYKNKNLKNGMDAFKDGKTYGEDHVALWELGGTYNFNDKLSLAGVYAGNPDGNQDSDLSHAYSAQLQYGEGDEGDKGAYDVYAAYRYLGNYATFSPTWAGDGSAVYGAKGWEIGTNVTFMKNMVARLSYFDGKYISKNYNDGKDVNQVFGEVDIFF